MKKNYQSIEHLAKKTWAQGWVVLVVSTKLQNLSLVSGNIERTARRQLDAQHLLSGEYLITELNDSLSPKHALSKMNLDGGVHVLAYF